jgi:hypothetical protein
LIGYTIIGSSFHIKGKSIKRFKLPQFVDQEKTYGINDEVEKMYDLDAMENLRRSNSVWTKSSSTKDKKSQEIKSDSRISVVEGKN